MNDNLRQPNHVKRMQMLGGMSGVPDSHDILYAGEDTDAEGSADTFDSDVEGAVVFSFIPEGDATFSEMEEAGQAVAAHRVEHTYGDRIPVQGRFTRLVVESGKVHIYKVKL